MKAAGTSPTIGGNIILHSRAKLFLSEGRALYIGPLQDTSAHKHHAAQVTIGLTGPFRIHMHGDWSETRFAVLRPNAPHQIISSTPVAVALFDGASAAGGIVKRCELPVFGIPKISALPDSMADMVQFIDQILAPLGASKTTQHSIDSRISDVLQRLEDVDVAQIKATDLAGMVGLSEGRFLHLFSTSVGLPMRRYILWRRIIKSVRAAADGADLTTAAYAGGFSDSAHFSRIFRATFGLSPSKMFKNSRNIQVFTT